jgi:hypothetical protein
MRPVFLLGTLILGGILTAFSAGCEDTLDGGCEASCACPDKYDDCYDDCVRYYRRSRDIASVYGCAEEFDAYYFCLQGSADDACSSPEGIVCMRQEEEFRDCGGMGPYLY